MVLHCAVDTSQDELGRPRADLQYSHQVFRVDRTAAQPDEEYRLEPNVHENVAGLEDCIDLDGKGFAASIAFVGTDARARTLQAADAPHLAAPGADWTLRPDAGFDVSVSLFLALKSQVGEQLHDRAVTRKPQHKN
jgi:hypothetical protein